MTHLAKVQIDLDDANRALKGYLSADNTTDEIRALYLSFEALMRATSSLLRHAEDQARGKQAVDRREHVASMREGGWL